MTNKADAIDLVFNPRSVALVGASNMMNKWGFQILHNTLMGKYSGRIYPINPKEKEILGLTAYRSVLDVPDAIDLAIFTVPAEKIPGIIPQCIKKGIKAGLVITAGFSEVGEEGARLEREMTRLAREGGMILVGPNGQGIACPSSQFYPWMPAYFPETGGVSIISQSGNILTWIAQGLADYGFGIAKAVSCGNLCDVSWEDYLIYLERDAETKVILLYMEGISQGKSFFETARKVNRVKPIIIFKGGRGDLGFRAARTHTGAMAGNNAVFDAACKQAGLIRADTMQEAVCLSAGFVASPLPRGNRLGIVTTGGGLGVIAADLCTQYGIELPEFTAATNQKIKDLMPPWWAPGNPVDMVAGIGYANPTEIVSILIESGEIDGIMFIGLGWSHRMADYTKYSPLAKTMDMSLVMKAMRNMDLSNCLRLKEIIRTYNVPVVIYSNVAPYVVASNYETLGELLNSNIMLFPSLELATRMFRSLYSYSRTRGEAPA